MNPANGSATESSRVAGGMFCTTRWSVVTGARGDSEDAHCAVEELCRIYWRPVFAFIARTERTTRDTAADLTQDFFAHFLEKRVYCAADRERGRFRCFLLTAVKFFLSHVREKARAAKRGGTYTFLALDEFTEEAREHLDLASGGSPEDEFDRQWARQVLDLALKDLELEYRDSGRAQAFERLKPFLIADPSSGQYEQCSRQWEMSSGTIAVAVHRLRQRFATKVREQLRQTLGESEDIHAELRYLMRHLAD